MENNINDIKLYGKIAKFPKKVKSAKNAFDFLENIKISKRKLWYFIIEKETDSSTNEELQIIKYNNKAGINCYGFVNELKNHYSKNPELLEYVENLTIEGDKYFSKIKNIPDVTINDKKLITIITEDLIKLLYK